MRLFIGMLAVATMACGGQPEPNANQPEPVPKEQPKEITGTFLSLVPSPGNRDSIEMLYLDDEGRLRSEWFSAYDMTVDHSAHTYGKQARFDHPLSQGDRFRMTRDADYIYAITKLE